MIKYMGFLVLLTSTPLPALADRCISMKEMSEGVMLLRQQGQKKKAVEAQMKATFKTDQELLDLTMKMVDAAWDQPVIEGDPYSQSVMIEIFGDKVFRACKRGT